MAQVKGAHWASAGSTVSPRLSGLNARRQARRSLPTERSTTRRRRTRQRSAGVILMLATLLAVAVSLPGAVTEAAASRTRTVKVPASIDYRGRSDVSSELQRFVNGVPNGSTISFRKGGTYRVSRGIRLTARHDLAFDGNGATLRTTGPANSVNSSLFVLADDNKRITIRQFTLVGSNAAAGTSLAYSRQGENQMGIAIYGSSNISIHHVTFRRMFGDCVYIGSKGTTVWSNAIRFRDSKCTLTGRHGVTIIAGRNVTVERVRFDRLGMFVIDIEPDYSTQGATNVVIRRNSVGSYGLNNRFTSWLLAAEGANGSVIRRVTVSGNRISGSPSSGYEGKALGLHVTVKARGTRERFVIKDNVSTRRVAGPSLEISGVHGLTVTGNTQRLRSGSLARIAQSSSVIQRNNITR